MTLLAPAALALLSLSIPLVVLYMLRSRRHRVEVPSVRLWSGEEEHVSAALPWQRLRITAALILQLLALALFAFLLARPFFRETTLLGPHTVIVADTSGSMAMAGRFEAARAAMLDLVAEASDEQLVSLVDSGPNPRVLAAFSRDPDALAGIVGSLQVGGGTESPEAALRLARGLASPDRPTTVLLVGDGGFEGALPEPVTDARHLRFDASGDNVAITGFDTSPVGDGPPRVFVEVASFSGRTEDVRVALDVDGLGVGAFDVSLPPGERRREILPIDAGPGQTVTARIVAAGDANPMDDTSSIVLSAAAEISATVTGKGSPFLDALIDATPGVVAPVGAPPDVVIADGGSAAEIDRPTWLLRPEVPPPGLEVIGRLDHPVVTYTRPGEPIVDGLDLSGLVIAEADVVEGPGWLPIVSAGDVPLVLLGDVDGHRVVYFTFDIVRSNLPVQVAFPILGSRLLDWLGGSRIGTAATADAGTPIPVVAPAGTSTVVTPPDGEGSPLDPGIVSFTRTQAPGVYTVEFFDEEGEVVSGFVASRRFAAAESAGPSRSIAVVEPEGADLDESTLVREWAPTILGVLLALVLLEWWVAFGRPLPWRRRDGAGRGREAVAG